METRDAGSYYEPYGNLNISIGQRTDNQNINLWYLARATEYKQLLKTPFTFPIERTFLESLKFLDPGEQESNVILEGKVMEADDTNPDDQLFIFDGYSFQAFDAAEGKWFREQKHGSASGNITIRIEPLKPGKSCKA